MYIPQDLIFEKYRNLRFRKQQKFTQILCDKMETLTSSSPKNFQNLRENHRFDKS